MCTAATYKKKNFYFGRTLDYEFSYGDEITITPRKFPLAFRHSPASPTHYAMIGMAHAAEGYPLYYDAVNEKGLCMAGLNFVGNAVYFPAAEGKTNVAQFELIPYILSTCASVNEARKTFENMNITDERFSAALPCAQLHWIVADKNDCITVEQVAEGLKIYDNPAGVLTNNPPFDMQLFNLNNYMRLSPRDPANGFSEKLDLTAYSRGMGGLGLPGDLSSPSRFVRAAFTKLNSVCGDGESECVGQFFHILGSVNQQRGCCELANGKLEITIYTSCCNADRGIYYYTTYTNRAISAVDMHRADLSGKELIRYAPEIKERITFQN